MRIRRVVVLSPIAWRSPPRQYGAWETVASNVAEGLVARGWEVTLFATGDYVTCARLHEIQAPGPVICAAANGMPSDLGWRCELTSCQ